MKKERTIEELYANDPERADAEAFGRKAGLDRRGFLGGAGLRRWVPPSVGRYRLPPTCRAA